MKSTIISLAMLFPVLRAWSQGPTATLDHKAFYAPGKGNYIETHMAVNPLTCNLQKVENGLQATLEVLYIVHQDDKIVDYRKKNISSPVFKDTLLVDFIDQERFVLEPGAYELEMQVTDLNVQPAAPIRGFSKFIVDDLGKRIQVSDIELLEQYTKAETTTESTRAGYNLVPYVSFYYPQEVDKIAFYAEIYMSDKSMDKNQTLILYQYIEEVNSGKAVEGLGKFRKISPQPVTSCLHAFNITDLPSGDYNLVVEVKNKSGEVISRKIQQFQRVNKVLVLTEESIRNSAVEGTFVEKMNNKDSLNDYIACLRPIASIGEINMLDKHLNSSDMLTKKQFLYSFWQNRDSEKPGELWLAYRAEVNKAEKLFRTRIKHGYETERGRVYLKYGAPNQIVDRPNEPSAYPYQIWFYYKSGKYNNKRFIFYMPDLVTNDYDLLHSDVPGEYKNYRWEYTLHSRNSTNTNIDATNGGNVDHYGGNSMDYWRLPR